MVTYREEQVRPSSLEPPPPAVSSDPEDTNSGPAADLTLFYQPEICSEEQLAQCSILFDSAIQGALEEAQEDWECIILDEAQLVTDLRALQFSHENMRAAIKQFLGGMDSLRDSHPVEANLVELHLNKVLELFP